MSDDVRQLLDAYSAHAALIQTSITNINANIADLQAQKTTIEDDIMSPSETSQDALLAAKMSTNGWELLIKGSTYGVSDLTAWQIFNEYGSNWVVSDVDTFVIDGDFTTEYATSTVIGLEYAASSFTRVVASSTYDGVEDETTVVCTTDAGNPIVAGLLSTGILVYEYDGVGWDSDSDITANILAFAVAYEHIYHESGTTGTYGVNTQITGLQTALTVMTANKNHYDAFVTAFEPFASKWFAGTANITTVVEGNN